MEGNLKYTALFDAKNKCMLSKVERLESDLNCGEVCAFLALRTEYVASPMISPLGGAALSSQHDCPYAGPCINTHNFAHLPALFFSTSGYQKRCTTKGEKCNHH